MIFCNLDNNIFQIFKPIFSFCLPTTIFRFPFASLFLFSFSYFTFPHFSFILPHSLQTFPPSSPFSLLSDLLFFLSFHFFHPASPFNPFFPTSSASHFTHPNSFPFQLSLFPLFPPPSSHFPPFSLAPTSFFRSPSPQLLLPSPIFRFSLTFFLSSAHNTSLFLSSYLTLFSQNPLCFLISLPKISIRLFIMY